MSEADKLFEELGYKKWIDSRNITHFIHKKKEKDFTFMNGNCYSIKRPTKKEQIAINKKVEELRMDMSNKTSDINVGSIEEDIKILENLKSYLNLLVYEGKDKIIYNDLLWDEKTVDCINAIEHLINNYTRQKQINEEHQKINGELREKVKELDTKNDELLKDLYSANCIIADLTDSIPKQNIIEKIEELDRKEQELQNSISEEEREEYEDANISYLLCDIEIRREVLKELLQEGNK